MNSLTFVLNMLEPNNKMKGTPRFVVIAPILIAISLIVGMFLGQFLHFSFQETSGPMFTLTPKDNKLAKILSLIEADYVDTVDMDLLTNQAITALLEGLDPHSYYTPPADKIAFDEEISGSFDGIGIEFNMVNDTIVVLSALSGGPAEAVGLRSGDRIVEIEGKTVAGNKTPQDQIVKKLRGKKGTKVSIGIQRRGQENLLPFTITRDKIPLYTVEAAYMMPYETGYIRLGRFGEKSAQEVEKALKKLNKQGMRRLVFDLRGNPGGMLTASIDIADMFLPDGQLITYTEGRSRSRKSYHAYPDGLFETGPLAILIDEGSASASEIVSGAVQDNDRGIVIGRRSFGKGLVQEVFELSDGSGLALTVARYYTPSGRSIQRPYADGAEAYYQEAYHDLRNGGIPDSSAYPDSLKYETIYKRRTVYGGGGITPDVLIPLDTLPFTKFFEQAFNLGLVYDFAFDFADRNREAWKKKYPNGQGFALDGAMEPLIFSQFLSFCREKGVTTPPAQVQRSKSLLINRLKASIGRNIWGSEIYYQILGTEDSAIKTAVEQLKTLP